MLDVWEQLGLKWRLRILQEIERVLKSGGVFVMTSPTRCTKGLLDLLVRLNVLSPVEIRGYKATHSRKQILAILKGVGFPYLPWLRGIPNSL
jgi:SAM-dependent methyltransferase